MFVPERLQLPTTMLNPLLLDSAEGEVAGRLLKAIKNKESIDELTAVLESLTEVGKDHQSKQTLWTACT